MLSTYLVPFVRAFVFQVVNQSSLIVDFLSSIGGSFTASNGWTITTDKAPEISISRKIIYLRGRDTDRNLRIHRCWDLNSELAKTRYINEIDSALKELMNAMTAPRGDVGIDVALDLIWKHRSDVTRDKNRDTAKKIARA